jgi:hypothetical protein
MRRRGRDLVGLTFNLQATALVLLCAATVPPVRCLGVDSLRDDHRFRCRPRRAPGLDRLAVATDDGANLGQSHRARASWSGGMVRGGDGSRPHGGIAGARDLADARADTTGRDAQRANDAVGHAILGCRRGVGGLAVLRHGAVAGTPAAQTVASSLMPLNAALGVPYVATVATLCP